MFRQIAQLRPGAALRAYATATLLNLALVSTILTPPDRQHAARTRIVASAPRFSDTELIDLGDGEVGVLSVPYEGSAGQAVMGVN